MIYTKQAKGTVDEVVARIEKAAGENKFGVLGVLDLKSKMAAKGVAFGPECRIIEVCNPGQAKKMLEMDLRISNVLPCRISIYEQAGKVYISTIKPTAIMALFGDAGIEAVARSVEETLIRIIDASCG